MSFGRGWAKAFMQRMGFIIPNATKTTKLPPTDLIVNCGQTGVQMISATETIRGKICSREVIFARRNFRGKIFSREQYIREKFFSRKYLKFISSREINVLYSILILFCYWGKKTRPSTPRTNVPSLSYRNNIHQGWVKLHKITSITIPLKYQLQLQLHHYNVILDYNNITLCQFQLRLHLQFHFDVN